MTGHAEVNVPVGKFRSRPASTAVRLVAAKRQRTPQAGFRVLVEQTQQPVERLFSLLQNRIVEDPAGPFIQTVDPRSFTGCLRCLRSQVLDFLCDRISKIPKGFFNGAGLWFAWLRRQLIGSVRLAANVVLSGVNYILGRGQLRSRERDQMPGERRSRLGAVPLRFRLARWSEQIGNSQQPVRLKPEQPELRMPGKQLATREQGGNLVRLGRRFDRGLDRKIEPLGHAAPRSCEPANDRADRRGSCHKNAADRAAPRGFATGRRLGDDAQHKR